MHLKTPRTKRRPPCRHPPQYETDWLGRTYVGCLICNRWKVLKTKAASAQPKRQAA